MALLPLQSRSWSVELTIDKWPLIENLGCINSSNECVAELTEKAIASSHKLETLRARITLIEQRLAVAEDRIEYTRKKKWTNYISANPINILQNIFGGGDVQRDNIAITQCQASPDRISEKIVDAEIEKDEAVRERMATHTRIK